MQIFLLFLCILFLLKYIASGFESQLALALFSACATIAFMNWHCSRDCEKKILSDNEKESSSNKLKDLLEENERLKDDLKNQDNLKAELRNLNEIIIENSRDFSIERQSSENREKEYNRIERELDLSQSNLKTARKALYEIKKLSIKGSETILQKQIFEDKGMPEVKTTLEKIAKKAEFQLEKEKSRS